MQYSPHDPFGDYIHSDLFDVSSLGQLIPDTPPDVSAVPAENAARFRLTIPVPLRLPPTARMLAVPLLRILTRRDQLRAWWLRFSAILLRN